MMLKSALQSPRQRTPVILVIREELLARCAGRMPPMPKSDSTRLHFYFHLEYMKFMSEIK